MKTTKLRMPNGEQLESPSQSDINALLSMSKDVWEHGSGDAAFFRTSPSGSAMLILFRSYPDGYHLEHFPEVGRYDYFLSIGSGDMTACATSYVSGQPTELPIGVFVDRQTALNAIQEFLATGERSSALPWKNRRDLDWGDATE